jgi:hypothetical protein
MCREIAGRCPDEYGPVPDGNRRIGKRGGGQSGRRWHGQCKNLQARDGLPPAAEKGFVTGRDGSPGVLAQL